MSDPSDANLPAPSQRGSSEPRHRRRIWIWILASFGALVVFGFYATFFVTCAVTFVHRVSQSWDELVMDRPAPLELVGTYHLTDASERFLRNRKHYEEVPDSTIELRADGSVVIQNLADCTMSPFGESEGRFISAEGTWSIEDETFGYSISVEFPSPGLRGFEVYMGMFDIRRAEPPHVLERSIGDPDSAESLYWAMESD